MTDLGNSILERVIGDSVEQDVDGFPVTDAASAAIAEVCRDLESHDAEPLTVRFLLFNERLYEAYSRALGDRT